MIQEGKIYKFKYGPKSIVLILKEKSFDHCQSSYDCIIIGQNKIYHSQAIYESDVDILFANEH